MNSYNVLIVEDDPTLSDLFKFKFKNSGFNVHVAHNGEDGLKKAKKKLPDIILLDIIMPGLDGFKVLEELKKDDSTKSIKVYILSNLGQQEEIDKGLRLGADRYIVKAELNPDEAVEMVTEALGG